jgi:hypothetical protein
MIRKILKYLGYALLALVVLAIAAIILAQFAPPPSAGVMQTLSSNGKTVHLMQGDTGPISFSASMEGDAVIVNGQKLDLSGGDLFTVKIFTNGRMELHKGAP